MPLDNVTAAMQEALDTLDNFEALNRLNGPQKITWERARILMLRTMGAVAAIEHFAEETAA